jgi:hypothetical protein
LHAAEIAGQRGTSGRRRASRAAAAILSDAASASSTASPTPRSARADAPGLSACSVLPDELLDNRPAQRLRGRELVEHRACEPADIRA